MTALLKARSGHGALALRWTAPTAADLFTLDLDAAAFDRRAGVYVIWCGPVHARAVRIGQGHIRERLAAHRGDREVKAYWPLDLKVTWALLPAPLRNGVERWLAETLRPLVSARLPDVRSIPAALPPVFGPSYSLELAQSLRLNRGAAPAPQDKAVRGRR